MGTVNRLRIPAVTEDWSNEGFYVSYVAVFSLCFMFFIIKNLRICLIEKVSKTYTVVFPKCVFVCVCMCMYI